LGPLIALGAVDFDFSLHSPLELPSGS
jgi:hypothetical protein